MMDNDISIQKPLVSSSYANDHMANERTFLAWVRTSIGIMALGFVVERFGLYIKQMSIIMGTKQSAAQTEAYTSFLEHSSVIGSILVALAVFLCLLAFIKYTRVEKQINDNNFRPSPLLNTLLMITVLSTGVFLIYYLKNSM